MKFVSARSAVWALVLGCGTLAVSAQSTDQNFPSPVTTNEISGSIKVRDIGDSRVTSYYYAFDGGQGDIFINAVTRNFSGDIDVFTADEMRPLTKMVIYADSGSQETGRLIYLRKGERLILRVEGRSPNDDPASFRLKFGGSFIALAPEKTVAEPTVATTTEPNDSGVRVNSVGTIIAVVPKPQPVKPPTIAKVSPPVRKKRSEAKKPPAPPREKPKAEPEPVLENDEAKLIVEPEKKPDSKPPAKTKTAAVKPPKEPETSPEPAADPLASIWLVIELKDGNTIRRPMSEVTKFNVEKGTLVVTAKNGKVVRYRILEVAKVTIE